MKIKVKVVPDTDGMDSCDECCFSGYEALCTTIGFDCMPGKVHLELVDMEDLKFEVEIVNGN